MRLKYMRFILLTLTLAIISAFAISALYMIGNSVFVGNTSDDPMFRLVQASKNLDSKEITNRITSDHLNVNVTNGNGDTPLHLAVAYNENLITELVKNGANVDAQDKDGNTALHFAAANGRLVSVKLLIEQGANRKLKNVENQTPLDLALSDINNQNSNNKNIILLLRK